MGIIIIIIVAIIEAGFTYYCIATRSPQLRIRSIIHIGSFAAFIMLTLLGVFKWGLPYLPLALCLLILAGIGAIRLIHKSRDGKQFTIAEVAKRGLLTTLILGIAAFPAVLFPQYHLIETTGEYKVNTVTYTWVDNSRVETYTNTGEQRKITVHFWHPEIASGTYPLVVFSHGGFGVRTSNESLYNELASHGYVVASIGHTYHSLYVTDTNGHTTWINKSYMKELSTENALIDREQSYMYYQKWMAIRTSDISFVIDRVLAEANADNVDTVYKLVDTERIGVMGHSLGGSAALCMGRLRSDIRAVIALESPLLCDIVGVRDGEFIYTSEPYPVPVLNVYSDTGWRILADRPQYKSNHALLSYTDGTAHNVHIQGVGHFTLTDLALASPILTRILNGQKSTTNSTACLKEINQLSLGFFDFYLKGKGAFAPATLPR